MESKQEAKVSQMAKDLGIQYPSVRAAILALPSLGLNEGKCFQKELKIKIPEIVVEPVKTVEIPEIKTKFQPSKYQQVIYDFIEKGTGNAVVNAVAGSGKTTTIVNLLSLIDPTKSIIFVAFNKSIVNELKTRVPTYVEVSTMHSVGWRAIINKYGRAVKLEERKVIDYLKQVSKSWFWADDCQDDQSRLEYINRVKKLVDLCRVNLIKNSTELEEQANRHEIELTNGECLKAVDTVRALMNDHQLFDFTDMIFVPAVDETIAMKKYDFVFVDECQDLNAAQQKILRKLLKPDGRFIAVGDPNQAIYGFAGADVNSFRNLQNQPNTISLPLSVCYRCGTEIINLAKTIVPQIEAREGAALGLINRKGKNEDIKQGDYVLCRNTAPLVLLCLQTIAQGKKATILGGEIGRNLINMIKKSKEESIIEMNNKFANELQKIFLKLQKKGMTIIEIEESVAYRIFSEKCEVINLIAEQNGFVTASQIIAEIEIIFSDNKEGIIFSTIHKAKGLEADRIHIICEELMPSKYAKQPWQKEQERNLQYVAYTRAKKELIFNKEFIYLPKN